MGTTIHTLKLSLVVAMFGVASAGRIQTHVFRNDVDVPGTFSSYRPGAAASAVINDVDLKTLRLERVDETQGLPYKMRINSGWSYVQCETKPILDNVFKEILKLEGQSPDDYDLKTFQKKKANDE